MEPRPKQRKPTNHVISDRSPTQL